jgi:hypothetical protein
MRWTTPQISDSLTEIDVEFLSWSKRNGHKFWWINFRIFVCWSIKEVLSPGLLDATDWLADRHSTRAKLVLLFSPSKEGNATIACASSSPKSILLGPRSYLVVRQAWDSRVDDYRTDHVIEELLLGYHNVMNIHTRFDDDIHIWHYHPMARFINVKKNRMQGQMSLWPTTGRYFYHLTLLGKVSLHRRVFLAGDRHHSAAREHPSGLFITKKVWELRLWSGTNQFLLCHRYRL